ncbi:hypothetical protein FJY84_04110 [Candidatus Bathyarchaeota archaeon]|nr:hypothetical protein [Candidatus Bathyarchaeota archaeon]
MNTGRLFMILSRLLGFFKIIRPINSIMLGLAILVGILISSKNIFSISFSNFFFAFFSGFALTGSAMVINDYFDLDIDLINEPNRPLPSGLIKPKEALIYSIVLSILGLISSFFNGLNTLIIASIAWVIMMLYSSIGKRMGFIGNIMVSFCIALPFIYGGVLVSNLTPSLLFSLLAFLSNTGREITKGIVDVEGDKKQGIRTIAVLYGVKNAVNLSILLYLSAVISSLLPILLKYVTFWYIPFVLFTDLGLIYISIKLYKDNSRENSRKMKNLVLFCMLSGLIGFALGSIL